MIVQVLPLNVSLSNTIPTKDSAYVRLKPILLFLLNYQLDEISEKRDISQINKFFRELLSDLNALSSEIYFRYSGCDYDYDDDLCEIQIDWYI